MTFGHDSSFALAGGTRCGDGHALTPALGTRGTYGQESLRAEHLAPALTGCAARRTSAVLASRATTTLTQFGAIELNVKFLAEAGLEKGQ